MSEPFTQGVPPEPQALTAFLVVIDHDGSANLVLDLQDPSLHRPATLRDARRALLELSADLAAQASAQYVLAAKTRDETPSEKVSKAVSKRRKKES